MGLSQQKCHNRDTCATHTCRNVTIGMLRHFCGLLKKDLFFFFDFVDMTITDKISAVKFEGAALVRDERSGLSALTDPKPRHISKAGHGFPSSDMFSKAKGHLPKQCRI